MLSCGPPAAFSTHEQQLMFGHVVPLDDRKIFGQNGRGNRVNTLGKRPERSEPRFQTAPPLGEMAKSSDPAPSTDTD